MKHALTSEHYYVNPFDKKASLPSLCARTFYFRKTGSEEISIQEQMYLVSFRRNTLNASLFFK